MKRFVSYLYSIYNNQKIHNAGFARVELRTGRNRIDIHLRENGYSGKTGTVYLFIRNQKNIHGISIGNISFHGSQADFRYEQPEENVGQTPWQITQMNGILIMIDNRAAFLSQWDEEPVDTERFQVWDTGAQQTDKISDSIQDGQDKGSVMSSENEAIQPDRNTQNSTETVQPDQSIQNGTESIQPDRNTQNSMETVQPDQSIQNGTESIQPDRSTRKGAKNNVGNIQDGQYIPDNTGYERPGHHTGLGEKHAAVRSGMDRKYEYTENEISMPDTETFPVSDTQEVHTGQEMNGADQLAEYINQPAERKLTTDYNHLYENADNQSDTSDLSDSDRYPSSGVSDIQTAELQPQLQPDNLKWEQAWRYMLRTYQVIHSFADESNVLCVRIEIKDFRLLPEKYWSMVNNSFLLHGFFNYRYLVFGRMDQNWFVGIPGIYQNQEHVMASIFGFPDFLPHKQKNERGEQPGYWYRILEI